MAFVHIFCRLLLFLLLHSLLFIMIVGARMAHPIYTVSNFKVIMCGKEWILFKMKAAINESDQRSLRIKQKVGTSTLICHRTTTSTKITEFQAGNDQIRVIRMEYIFFPLRIWCINQQLPTPWVCQSPSPCFFLSYWPFSWKEKFHQCFFCEWWFVFFPSHFIESKIRNYCIFLSEQK